VETYGRRTVRRWTVHSRDCWTHCIGRWGCLV